MTSNRQWAVIIGRRGSSRRPKCESGRRSKTQSRLDHVAELVEAGFSIVVFAAHHQRHHVYHFRQNLLAQRLIVVTVRCLCEERQERVARIGSAEGPDPSRHRLSVRGINHRTRLMRSSTTTLAWNQRHEQREGPRSLRTAQQGSSHATYGAISFGRRCGAPSHPAKGGPHPRAESVPVPVPDEAHSPQAWCQRPPFGGGRFGAIEVTIELFGHHWEDTTTKAKKNWTINRPAAYQARRSPARVA